MRCARREFAGADLLFGLHLQLLAPAQRNRWPDDVKLSDTEAGFVCHRLRSRGRGCQAPEAPRGVMNNPDQDTLVRAVEDARRILGEYIEPGRPRDAARTVERLLAVLDRNDVIHALDRIKRRRVIRLVE